MGIEPVILTTLSTLKSEVGYPSPVSVPRISTLSPTPVSNS